MSELKDPNSNRYTTKARAGSAGLSQIAKRISRLDSTCHFALPIKYKSLRRYHGPALTRPFTYVGYIRNIHFGRPLVYKTH